MLGRRTCRQALTARLGRIDVAAIIESGARLTSPRYHVSWREETTTTPATTATIPITGKSGRRSSPVALITDVVVHTRDLRQVTPCAESERCRNSRGIESALQKHAGCIERYLHSESLYFGQKWDLLTLVTRKALALYYGTLAGDEMSDSLIVVDSQHRSLGAKDVCMFQTMLQ